MKLSQQTADNIFYTFYLAWLFGIQWIWPNSSGRLIMLIFFGSTMSLKVIHLLWYMIYPNQTENCCGQLVKWLGVIGSLLKFVDIRQVMLGTQWNNGTKKQFDGLAPNIVFHSLNLVYNLGSILYFYLKKRKQSEKYLTHVSVTVNSTCFM